MRFRWIIAIVFCLLCLTSCAQAETSRLFLCQVMLEDSLWPGIYLYSADNHLSTEGIAIHTDRIIAALKAQFAAEEKEGTP